MKYYKIILKSGEALSGVEFAKHARIIDGFIGVVDYVDVSRVDSPMIELVQVTRYINLDTIAEIVVEERVKE